MIGTKKHCVDVASFMTIEGNAESGKGWGEWAHEKDSLAFSRFPIIWIIPGWLLRKNSGNYLGSTGLLQIQMVRMKVATCFHA